VYPAEERQANPFGSLLTIFQRRSGLMATVFLAVLAAGAVVTLLQKPKYTATAQLLVNPNPDQVVPEKQALTNSRADAGEVESELEGQKAPALGARLADELDLDKDPEWNGALKKTGAKPTDPKSLNYLSFQSDAEGTIGPPPAPGTVKAPSQ